jgi:hypothetical protein
MVHGEEIAWAAGLAAFFGILFAVVFDLFSRDSRVRAATPLWEPSALSLVVIPVVECQTKVARCSNAIALGGQASL